MPTILITHEDGTITSHDVPAGMTAEQFAAAIRKLNPARVVTVVETDNPGIAIDSQSATIGLSETSALQHPVANVAVKGAIVGGALAVIIVLGILLWRLAQSASKKGAELGSRAFEKVKEGARTKDIPDASVHLDSFYAEAYREIGTESVNAASWAKAFAHASGDDAKTKALYIRYRVEQLRSKPLPHKTD